MSKYDEMKAFYEERIEKLKNEVDFWRERALSKSHQADMNRGRVEAYGKVIDRLLGHFGLVTDEIFMFEGRGYRPVSFTLNRDNGEPDTLDVEFVAVDIPDAKKENSFLKGEN